MRAFSEIFANVSRFVPYFHRYSRPAPPNICAVSGPLAKPCVRFSTSTCRSTGFTRSSYLAPSAPFSIFSKPSASTHSASPPSMACRARYSAVEPVEQLLFTLMTGMPVSPSPYTARWPQVLSP